MNSITTWRRLMALGLLQGLVVASLAEERRDDSATYLVTEPGLRPANAASLEVAVPTPVDEAAPPDGLATLRARQAGEMAAIVQQLGMDLTPVEREAIEQRAMALKVSHQRAELEWLMTRMSAAGSTGDLSRLEDALRQVEARPAPQATTWLPRDPAAERPEGTQGEGARK